MEETKLTYLGDVLSSHPEWVPDWNNDCRTNDFVDTRRFSPVIYDEREAMPDRNNPEYDAWWLEQYKRCITGYVVPKATRRGHDIWIPGRYYFYLNFWKIQAKLDGVNRKGLRNPRFTSLDYFKAMSIEVMFLERVDQAYGKARQKGFSEFIASNVAYNFIFIPYSINVIVAGVSDYSEHTMENVTRGLDDLATTEFHKRRSPDRASFKRAMYVEKIEDVDEYGVGMGTYTTMLKGYGSEIYCLTAKDNTQAVSRLTPFFIVYEEIGKWKKGSLIETTEFVAPSLKAEGEKTGYQVMIGTGGDIEESVTDVQKIMYNPAAYGIKSYKNIFEEDLSVTTGEVGCFIPGYLFEIIDDDGNSLIAESIASILKDRENKSNEQQYRAATQKPLYLSEMFMVASGGYFGRDIAARLNDRKRFILNHKELQVISRYNIEWIDHLDWSKGVRVEPDEDGVFIIIEHPQKDEGGKHYINLYNAATDSYDKSESETSESKGSCTIWKNYLNANSTYRFWVARLTQRPTEEEGGSPKFYENTVKLCVYYGYCQNLIEYSNVLIFDYYKRWGMEYLLKERPSLVISQYVNDPKAHQRYGVEQSFVPHALKMLKEEFRADDYALIHRLYDIEMIEKFIAFRTTDGYNCDITIGCALNIAAATEDRELDVYREEEEEDSEDFGGYTIGVSNIISRL